jgi:hypothetical protein
MPAKKWSGKIGSSEDVEAPRECHARHAVESGQVPCDLRFVDGEMGCDGASESLCDEDVVCRG